MPRQGLTRARVVEAAAALADEAGLENVSFAALASRLGTSAPALYKHVDGLNGLRRDLTILGLTELGEELSAATIGKSGREALAATAAAYRSYAKRRPGLVNVVLRAPDPGDREHEAAAERALGIMRQVLEAYDLDDHDMVHAVRQLRTIMHGFAVLEQAGGFGMPEPLDETYRRLIVALDESLRRAAIAPETDVDNGTR